VSREEGEKRCAMERGTLWREGTGRKVAQGKEKTSWTACNRRSSLKELLNWLRTALGQLPGKDDGQGVPERLAGLEATKTWTEAGKVQETGGLSYL